MARKWTRENVLEESKKYSSRSEFKKTSSGAFHIAYIIRRNDLVGSPCTKTKQMDERCSF